MYYFQSLNQSNNACQAHRLFFSSQMHKKLNCPYTLVHISGLEALHKNVRDECWLSLVPPRHISTHCSCMDTASVSTTNKTFVIAFNLIHALYYYHLAVKVGHSNFVCTSVNSVQHWQSSTDAHTGPSFA